MGVNRVQNRSLNKVQSKLARSRTGRQVLTVVYAGNNWDAAIEQAIQEHGLGAGVTVIAVPEGMI